MSDQPTVDTLRHNFENAKDRIQQLEDGRLAERRQIANLQGEIRRLTEERDAWSVRAGIAEAQIGELLTETRAEIVRLTEDRDQWRQYALDAKAKWEDRALEAQAALLGQHDRVKGLREAYYAYRGAVSAEFGDVEIKYAGRGGRQLTALVAAAAHIAKNP